MDRNALASMLMPEGSGPQYNALAMPSQVMSAYSPTWRDQLASWLMGDQKPSPERSRLVEGLTGSTGLSGGSGFGVADIVPGGQVLAAQEAGRKGDYSGMVMGMVGGPAGKVPGRGQIANALAPEQPRGQVTSMFTRQSVSPDQYAQNAQAIPALRKQVADADAAFRSHEATLVGPDGLYTAAGANDQRLRVLGDDLEMLKLRLAYAERDPMFSNGN